MTFQEACKKAQTESENGYVQHVSMVCSRYDGQPLGTKGDRAYCVEDWYNGSNTVASYENGRLLMERPLD